MQIHPLPMKGNCASWVAFHSSSFCIDQARVLGSRDVLNGDLCPTLVFMNEGKGGGRYKGRVAGTEADSKRWNEPL